MSTQTWNPDHYVCHAGFVAELGGDLIDMLDPRPGQRVLDLGCGDGALTERLAARDCEVVGVDSSAAQVGAARARGLDARVVDGESLAFEAEFDAVISNAALHWMKRPRRVLAGVAKALRPGGRFVAEMGGAGNVASVVECASALLAARGLDAQSVNPWYFPDEETYAALLEAHGFRIDALRLFERPTTLPGEVRAWLELFAQSFAAALPADARDAFYDELGTALEPRVRGSDGVWVLDYVRLRFAATLADSGSDA